MGARGQTPPLSRPLVTMNKALHRFYDSLHHRGLNQAKLAALSVTNRSHLCQVLNNKPGHGHHTRRRLFPYLNAKEIALLGWTAEYEKWRANGTHRSTQNIVVTPTPDFMARCNDLDLLKAAYAHTNHSAELSSTVWTRFEAGDATMDAPLAEWERQMRLGLCAVAELHRRSRGGEIPQDG